jgi:glycerophosphoryl diester phosphodiesterase
MKTEEINVISKTGRPDACEDLVYIGQYYAAVIDGTTSKTNRTWNGRTGGQIAGTLVKGALGKLHPEATFKEAAEALTSAIHELYISFDCLETVRHEPMERATATAAIYSGFRREIWLIGDCQALVDGQLIRPQHYVDEVSSAARAMYLSSELMRGVDISVLRETDPGLAYISGLLKRQTDFQNNYAAGQYFYTAVDGFPIPANGIVVWGLPTHVNSVVLATDGYPALRESLAESEAALADILTFDPLMIGVYRSTKGLRPGDISFDDRAYLRISISDTSL